MYQGELVRKIRILLT